MRLFLENRGAKEHLLRVFLIAGGAFCLTSLVLLVSGAPPWPAFYYLFVGALGSWSKLAQGLMVWIPLTLCACGLLYSFRIGLWNIGVEGQVVAGAIASTAVLRFGVESGSPFLMIVLAFAGGMLGGSAWAILAGFLKTKGGVNEIFGGLGLNFVAQGITLWLIFGPWKRPGVGSMSGTEVFPEALWLPTFLSGRLSPGGLGVTVAALVAAAWVLNRTRLGLALKGIGSNPRAAYLQLRLSRASGGDARQLPGLGVAVDCLLFRVPECGKHPASHCVEAGLILERNHPGSVGAHDPARVRLEKRRPKRKTQELGASCHGHVLPWARPAMGRT
jgi:ABC-type uncharacterized transport system permease subunit